MTVLVIPSIRENSLKLFLEKWKEFGDWDKIILVEDNPTKTFTVQSIWPVDHYSWKEIDEDLGEDSWIISRRDSAIRSYGFYKAYQEGADFILTLDDDCYPDGDFFICAEHSRKMNHYKWSTSVPNMRTRGLPYENLGVLFASVNMGFWSNVPDLDAVQSLNNLELARGDFEPPKGNRLIPKGQYFPLCGMNLAFLAEVTPLMYFPLMGKDQPYSRFDDIWCGIIMKKIADHLDYNISVGEPHILHSRASNIYTNLVKEAPGIKTNESFWQVIDSVNLTGQNCKNCILEIGAHLSSLQDDYLSKLGKALVIWGNLFV